ncbi:unnamed protein product [Medioppia subpectinata]|uniref:MMS19 nucleotide excision repair protein n=1 Tax=Medioppia subpectinata TaxID=1979941 RepID=A0A7R9KFW9_9ACAR|nr:unnamed protein product [Medioppia subpectinata]CAG2102638.1 unnamed protein product [Medioppia subpectinata]
MDSLFGVLGRGVSKLNIKYSQHLSESLLQFSVMGKVDELLPVLPPTCFCTYETGLKFLDSLNATQALIVFGLTNELISNLKYQINADQLTELFDKLVIFATNNKYNNLKICILATKSIGALVNRFDGKIDALNEKLKQFLKQTEERLDDSELSEENQLLIINALIWSTKGLVIGGHIVRKDFIALLMKLIEHNNSLIRNEISKAFAVIQSKDESCLTSENNANVRILYNQSFYFETFDTLLSGYLKYKTEDSDRKQIFLSALLTQLNLIPKAVFCNELKRLLPMLLDAISDHSITSDCCRDNQRAALDAIYQILIDKNERILDPSLKSTVNNCVNLSINSPYLEVRRSALNCLAEIAHNFEDSILNHLRDEVVRNLRKTLNDRKRIVRKSAVRARCKWILIGQPGK